MIVEDYFKSQDQLGQLGRRREDSFLRRFGLKLLNTYRRYLLENNCTTKSVDALIHGGTKLKFLIQKIQFTNGKSLPFIKTEPIYSPRDLMDFFNENNK